MDVLEKLKTINNMPTYSVKYALLRKFFYEKIQQVYHEAVPVPCQSNSIEEKLIPIEYFDKSNYYKVIDNAIVCTNISFGCSGTVVNKKREFLGVFDISTPDLQCYSFSNTNEMKYMLRKINDSIKNWETEFYALVDSYAAEINEAQLQLPKIINSWYGYVESELEIFACFRELRVKNVLDVNPQLINQLQQKGFEVERIEYPEKQSNDYKIKLKNYRLTIKCDCSKLQCEILDKTLPIPCFIITSESLHELDAKIPQWIKQGKNLEREYVKLQKIQEIGFQSIEILVKNKMRELRTEYDLEKGNDGSAVLKIKTNAKRYIKFKISYKDLQKVQKTLNTIPQVLEQLKQIPSVLKMGIYGNDVRWKKEE